MTHPFRKITRIMQEDYQINCKDKGEKFIYLLSFQT